MFADSASALYGVPAEAIVGATGALFGGTAPPEVVAAAEAALAGVAGNLGLGDGPVGDGDYLGAAGALIGGAAGGPIGAVLGTILGYLINAIARALSDDPKYQEAGEG